MNFLPWRFYSNTELGNIPVQNRWVSSSVWRQFTQQISWQFSLGRVCCTWWEQNIYALFSEVYVFAAAAHLVLSEKYRPAYVSQMALLILDQPLWVLPFFSPILRLQVILQNPRILLRRFKYLTSLLKYTNKNIIILYININIYRV